MFDLEKVNFQDKRLTCIDCGKDFTFTRGEQIYFAGKPGLIEPKRCPECRLKRKRLLELGMEAEGEVQE